MAQAQATFTPKQIGYNPMVSQKKLCCLTARPVWHQFLTISLLLPCDSTPVLVSGRPPGWVPPRSPAAGGIQQDDPATHLQALPGPLGFGGQGT